jgi:hypothetical protein
MINKELLSRGEFLVTPAQGKDILEHWKEEMRRREEQKRKDEEECVRRFDYKTMYERKCDEVGIWRATACVATITAISLLVALLIVLL